MSRWWDGWMDRFYNVRGVKGYDLIDWLFQFSWPSTPFFLPYPTSVHSKTSERFIASLCGTHTTGHV